jgi:hypothetical protein
VQLLDRGRWRQAGGRLGHGGSSEFRYRQFVYFTVTIVVTAGMPGKGLASCTGLNSTP